MAKTNVFTKAKNYRKLHPNVSFQDAIQKVSGKAAKPVAGARKKGTVSGAKKVGAVKRLPAKRKSVSSMGARKPKAGKVLFKSKVDNLQIYEAEINRLEALRKKAKTKDVRDAYQRLINAQHDKIDAVGKRNRR